MSKKSTQDTAKVKKRKFGISKLFNSAYTIFLYFCILMIFWSAALFLLARMDLNQIDKRAEEFAINKTRSLLEKDVTYYQWVGSQTDIYFVKTQQENDSPGSVNTDSLDAANQRIELMQFTADALLGLSQNIWAKRTGSIIAIYTDFNQAQEPAQLDALKLIFEGKARSISGLRQNGDKQYMNVMLPLEFNSNSSNSEGTKVTKVISLQYPMQEFREIAGKEKTILAAKYTMAWLLGMVLLVMILIRLYVHIRTWDKAADEQNKKNDDLQTKVNLRTQEVIQSRKNLQSFMDQMPLSAYIKNRENIFVAVNQSFADSIDCTKEKLIGTTGAGYFPPELADYFYQFEQVVFNSGNELITGDFEFAHHGPHFGIMSPVFGTYGQVDGVSTVLSPLELKEQYEQNAHKEGVSLTAGHEDSNSSSYFVNDDSLIHHDYHSDINYQPSTDHSTNAGQLYETSSESLKADTDSNNDPFNTQFAYDQKSVGESQAVHNNWEMNNGLLEPKHDSFDNQLFNDQELNTGSKNLEESLSANNKEIDFSNASLDISSHNQEHFDDTVQTHKDLWSINDSNSNGSSKNNESLDFVSAQEDRDTAALKPTENLWDDKNISAPNHNLFDTLQVKENLGSFVNNESENKELHEQNDATSEEYHAPFDPIVDLAKSTEDSSSGQAVVETSVEQPQIIAEEPVKPSSVLLNMLIINDDANEGQALSELLTKLGHEVKLAKNATSGIDYIAKNGFDMVFMDIQMPVMNGIQATALIRKQERQSNSKRMPIIAIAAHSNPNDKEKYQACGMDNYILTTASVNDVSEIIEEVISEFDLKG